MLYPFFQITNGAEDINTLYVIINTGKPTIGHWGKLYRSYDGGASWHYLSVSLPIDIHGVASDPVLGSVVLVNGEDGIYRSDDKGITWP